MVFWELTLNAYPIGRIIYTMYLLRKLFALEEKALVSLEESGLDSNKKYKKTNTLFFL